MNLNIFLSLAVAALVVGMPLTVYWAVGGTFMAAALAMYVTPGLYLSDGLVGCVLLAAALARPWRLRGGAWLGIPLAGIGVLALVSTPGALAPGLALYTALRWLLAAGLFAALLQLRLVSERLAGVLLAGLGLQAAVGIVQFLLRRPLGLPGEMALSVDQPPRAATVVFQGVTWLRAYGLTFHPNLLGGFLAAGLVLSLPLVKNRAARLAWWLCGAGLVVTFSRSGWLMAALGVPLAAAWLAWKRPDLRCALAWTLGMVLAGVAAMVLIEGGALLSRLDMLGGPSDLKSFVPRGELIQIALDQIRDHPLTGTGAGNFPIAQGGYPTQDPPHYVHFVALLLAAEVGPLGGLAWLWLWLAPGLAFERAMKKTNIWLGVVTIAWLCWGMSGLWDSYPWALESGRLFSVFLLAWCAREWMALGEARA